MSDSSVRRGLSRRAQALLGLVALALFATAVAGTWHLLKGGFQSGTPVSAVFSERGVGQQLPVGGDVKVRGVLVGRISDISLGENGAVVVEMQLNGDAGDLSSDSAAEVRSKTLFGEKWIELIPPVGPSAEALAAGSVIPDSRTKEPLELERELQLGSDLLSSIPLGDLSILLQSLAEGFSGSERDAQVAIDEGLVALRAVNARADELDLGLRQLGEFSQWLDDNSETLLGFMRSLDDANRALVGNAPAFESSLQSVPVFLNDFAAFQERTEADLGRLIEDGATVAEIVADRSDGLTDIIVQLEAFLTVWNSGLRQDCAGLYESDLTCWQVYVAPGLESRGLYGRGDPPPNEDEPGDPGNGRIGRSIARVDADARGDFTHLLELASDGRISGDLARLLYEPALSAGAKDEP